MLGDWNEASARIVENEQIDREVDGLLSKKHNLMKYLFSLFSTIQRRKYVTIEIEV